MILSRVGPVGSSRHSGSLGDLHCLCTTCGTSAIFCIFWMIGTCHVKSAAVSSRQSSGLVVDCLCLTRSTFAVSSGLLVLGVATQLGNLRSCQCTGPVELIAFCLSCNTTGTSTASLKDCAGWMNGDLVCETHCRNRLLDAEVLPRQRTDMTRLLLPAAAVVENGASTSGGSEGF